VFASALSAVKGFGKLYDKHRSRNIRADLKAFNRRERGENPRGRRETKEFVEKTLQTFN
jgi:hypothetical protein